MDAMRMKTQAAETLVPVRSRNGRFFEVGVPTAWWDGLDMSGKSAVVAKLKRSLEGVQLLFQRNVIF